MIAPKSIIDEKLSVIQSGEKLPQIAESWLMDACSAPSQVDRTDSAPERKSESKGMPVLPESIDSKQPSSSWYTPRPWMTSKPRNRYEARKGKYKDLSPCSHGRKYCFHCTMIKLQSDESFGWHKNEGVFSIAMTIPDSINAPVRVGGDFFEFCYGCGLIVPMMPGDRWCACKSVMEQREMVRWIEASKRACWYILHADRSLFNPYIFYMLSCGAFGPKWGTIKSELTHGDKCECALHGNFLKIPEDALSLVSDPLAVGWPAACRPAKKKDPLAPGTKLGPGVVGKAVYRVPFSSQSQTINPNYWEEKYEQMSNDEKENFDVEGPFSKNGAFKPVPFVPETKVETKAATKMELKCDVVPAVKAENKIEAKVAVVRQTNGEADLSAEMKFLNFQVEYPTTPKDKTSDNLLNRFKGLGLRLLASLGVEIRASESVTYMKRVEVLPRLEGVDYRTPNNRRSDVVYPDPVPVQVGYSWNLYLSLFGWKIHLWSTNFVMTIYKRLYDILTSPACFVASSTNDEVKDKMSRAVIASSSTHISAQDEPLILHNTQRVAEVKVRCMRQSLGESVFELAPSEDCLLNMGTTSLKLKCRSFLLSAVGYGLLMCVGYGTILGGLYVARLGFTAATRLLLTQTELLLTTFCRVLLREPLEGMKMLMKASWRNLRRS